MDTNDQVTVDILPLMDELHEFENELVTSPQEHNVMDTTTASQNQSHEEMVEIRTCPPQDEAVASKNGSSEEIVENVASHPLTNQADDPWMMKIHKKLSYVAKYNRWNIAYRDIFKEDPLKYTKYFTAKISEDGNTALHLATKNNSVEFVKQLIKYMLIEELTITNDDGDTAFLLAARNGRMEIVSAMLEKNIWLPRIRGYSGDLPIHRAAKLGHKEMVQFLYRRTRDYLNGEDHIKLINNLIRSGLYGLAHIYLYKKPELANCREESNGETALHILARTPKFANQKQQGIFKRCYKGSDSDKVRHGKLPPEALELVRWLLQQVSHLDEDKISEIIDQPWPVILDAVEQENVDFLAILIHKFPNLILRLDEKNHSIFHIAVLNRQMEIFKLIDHVGPMFKKSILEIKDVEQNNILHLAGMMPPLEPVNSVPGVALQLQQEFFWFKEVSKIVDPKHAKAKNANGKTPTDIFYEKTTALKVEAEKWVNDASASCMIAAALIATLVFAAAFAVPFTTQELFLKNFVISDAISLGSSFGSILTFLSIRTAAYLYEDFHFVLPRMFIFGFSTLFLSIAAMTVVFCASFCIVFKDEGICFLVLGSMIVSLPVILFFKQQWRLLYDSVRFTFKIGFLSKTSNSLLDNDEEKSWNLEKWKDAACWNFLEECWYSLYYRFCNY